MNAKQFWRNVVYVLLAINLLYGLWHGGGLRLMGLGPKPVQEPQRLENQVDPELLQLKPPASAPR